MTAGCVDPMTGKIMTGLFAAFTVGLGVPTCFLRGWRMEQGIPTKKMGLLSLEISSCGMMGGTGASGGGAVAGMAMASAGVLGNLGCRAVAHENQEGVLTWESYQAKTCRDATSSAVCLGSSMAGGMMDPTGYCTALRLRCEKIEGGKMINYFTFCSIMIGCICMAISGINIFREDERLKAICYSVFATLLILSGMIVYWGLGTEYFVETSMASTTTSGTCLYTGAACLLFSFLQSFSCIVCLASNDPDDDDDPESGRSKKKQKKAALAAAAAAVPDYGAQNAADYNLKNMAQAIKAMGGTDLDSAFRGFDVNGDGFITHQEFMSGVAQLNLGLNQEQTTWLMGWLDVNKDGYVAYGEFVEVMKKYEQNPGYVHQG